MTNRLLIINADDLGMHADINVGIIRAYEAGWVRSASLVVNMPAAEHAVQLAKDQPGLEVGIHLNVSSQTSVAPAHKLPDLVDADGHFLFDGNNMPASIRWFKGALQQKPSILDQIRLEFESQIEKFLKLSIKLAHINIHHYLTLLHPRLFDVYVQMAEEANVPFRGLCFPILKRLPVSPAELEQMTEKIGSSKSKSPDLSVSNLVDGVTESLPPDEYRQKMESTLLDLFQNDNKRSVELITHPALISSIIRSHDSYAWAREMETDLVTAPELGEFIRRLSCQLGGYRSLGNVN